LTTVDTAVKRFKPPFWCVVQQQQLDSFFFFKDDLTETGVHIFSTATVRPKAQRG
jgi:hypothetical protein